MKQPEELSAYKESVLQDIAQAQRVGADENAITALISQYPLDQALAAARPDAGLVLIDGMNHVLKVAPLEQGANIVTYRDPEMWKVTLPDTDELLKDCEAILTENRCVFVRDLCFEAKRRGIPVILDADRAMPLDEPLRICVYLVHSPLACSIQT